MLAIKQVTADDYKEAAKIIKLYEMKKAELKKKIITNNMIYDILFSLQNGFENKSLIMPYILKNTYFDSCIKIGNDIIPQKLH